MAMAEDYRQNSARTLRELYLSAIDFRSASETEVSWKLIDLLFQAGIITEEEAYEFSKPNGKEKFVNYLQKRTGRQVPLEARGSNLLTEVAYSASIVLLCLGLIVLQNEGKVEVLSQLGMRLPVEYSGMQIIDGIEK